MHAALAAALLALAAAPRTLRVEYFHTGNAHEERFSLDRVVIEPAPWPGNPARPIDDTGLGKYRFEVRAPDSGKLLYSRGFASVYGEWETTAEAKDLSRTFHESLRFPEPESPVEVVLEKRDAKNQWQKAWTARVDPKDMFVDPSPPPSPGPLIKLQVSGPPESKVDLLFLGDGYTAAERKKFEKDARRLMEVLFSYSPYKERRADFNVWGLCPPSPESGISRPSTGVHRRNPLGSTYDAFRSERYILTFDDRALRDAASYAPYEFLVILTNSDTYGGGGIFNLYSIVAAHSVWAPYLLIHEFSHHFAGLADEYYTSDTAYQAPAERIEPWEPNVTALLEPAALKWKDLVAPGTPIPTPWEKDAYEARAKVFLEKRQKIRALNRPESEMDALFIQQLEEETKVFAREKYAGKVGAFEGANYEARGYYRPQVDCIMFSRNRVPFCGVCQKALGRIADLYTRPSP